MRINIKAEDVRVGDILIEDGEKYEVTGVGNYISHARMTGILCKGGEFAVGYRRDDVLTVER
jgi:hypothetical protein